MLPFGIGFSEVLIILVVLLLVVGPGKLPDIARTLGKGVRAARRAGQELRDAI
ncbi:MAG: twin-arginine translocase TatA/TatE family subunit, partial [Myxococcales bacterium]|nr:twin-arginine translocase TatA/TatE family subunit [Myxococcales bacterium]